MPGITQEDLEAHIGGAATLRDLLDRNGDGAADQELVQQCLDAGEGETSSAVQVAGLNPDDPRVSSSIVLKLHKLRIAAYWAYQIGTKGQAVPRDVETAYEDTLRWLDKVATNGRTLGVNPAPETSYPVEVVDIDPHQQRINRHNMKGFC
jgi:phage gp36-like protein